MMRSAIAIPALAGVLAGCLDEAKTSSQSAPIVDCSTWGCGSNTPIAEGAPIEGLHLGGLANARGIRLIPDSLRGGRCTAVGPIDVQNGELVGQSTRGVCQGAGLVGARFQLEIAAPDRRPQQVTIRIAEVERVYTWTQEPAPQPLATYLLVEDSTGAPICPRDEAWMEPWQQLPLNPDLAPVWHTPTRHAIVVRGETYDGTDATVALSGSAAADWFNIACAGTAIAKMRLLGYDPLDPSSTRVQRQATLKMITARYCGRNSFTEPGMPVLWRSEPYTPYNGLPEFARVGEIEARWDERGAVCLSHARAWRANQPLPRVLVNYCRPLPCLSESDLIEKLQQTCGIPACTGSEPAFWTTHTVDHIAH
jgi:hypothetical protein